MHKALFLDRDGVINVDHGYVFEPKEFEFSDGIFELLKIASDQGYKLIVVTNQSGIARGYYTTEDFYKLTDFMTNELAKQGVPISAVYHCPHSPDDNCNCRKPKSGMFDKAIRDHDIDVRNSIMIGDKPSDIEAANSVGITKTFLVSSTNSLLDIIEIFKKELA